MQEPAHPGLEDDFALDDDQLFVEEQFYGPGEDVGFEGEAFFLDVLEGVGADVDMEDVLEDDRALIELFGDEVGGAAVDADAGLIGLAIGRSAGEVWEERGVDVDDPAGEG